MMSQTSLDARQRKATIESLESRIFDLVIVGGGINGAGIAHDAATRGLSVCLLEMKDLAFGTSSRSSKLIHGGLRYLEHYQFPLVFESTNERTLLRKIAPHLVRPLLFALPVYENDRHPLWKIQVGMWMYDGLSLFQAEQRHIAVRSQKRLLEREPLLRAEGLTGGIIYYDCITDDARLTFENALAASRLGAPIVTRMRVTQIDDLHARSGPVTVTAVDEFSGKEVKVRGRGVVNSTGVWTDRIRRAAQVESTLIRPTKGVHLVFPRERLPVNHAVALIAPSDGRVYFTIPWNGRTVVGTTDTDEHSDPSELVVNAADVDYLLKAANHAFPSANLGASDVISSWVGLRPLIKTEDTSASSVPREHQIFRDGRMVSVAGGKLTTYRRMSAETVDSAVEVIGARAQESKTASERLPGAIDLDVDLDVHADRLKSRANLPADVALRLAQVYGSRASEVLELARQDRKLLERVDPERDVIWAEIQHAVEQELALTVEDVLVRRTSLALTAKDQARGVAAQVADRLGRTLSWSAQERQARLDEFEKTVDRGVAFRSEKAR
ncbi:MAG: glycerol-3-phosphate dehydrogenase [Myxococcota bacterium]